MALVDAHPVPCRTDRHRHAWTSPDTEDQEYAATRCTACPIRRACRQYATRWTETGGVWGGRQEPAEKNPNPQRKDNQQ
ncbi:WhiB family transcriptional regulator [Kocuria sp.]|uniref:WhiB family transcriptional regulator n=1 Tax=Kocuria sp. TaxID=1871328 RepID=UPI0034CF023F